MHTLKTVSNINFDPELETKEVMDREFRESQSVCDCKLCLCMCFCMRVFVCVVVCDVFVSIASKVHCMLVCTYVRQWMPVFLDALPLHLVPITYTQLRDV